MRGNDTRSGRNYFTTLTGSHIIYRTLYAVVPSAAGNFSLSQNTTLRDFFCGFPFSGVTRISDAQGVVMASRDFVAIAEFVEVDPKSEVTVVAH